MCGGALVTPRIVFSAFHCAMPPGDSKPCDHSDKKRKAILGAHKNVLLEMATNPSGLESLLKTIQVIPIIEVLYPWFAGLDVEDLRSHDFAMFKLQKPARINQFVNTICLPHPGDSFKGLKAWAAGWGMHTKRLGSLSNELRKVRLTVSRKDYKHPKIFGTELSKGKDGLYLDPCVGDSGDIPCSRSSYL